MAVEQKREVREAFFIHLQSQNLYRQTWHGTLIWIMDPSQTTFTRGKAMKFHSFDKRRGVGSPKMLTFLSTFIGNKGR